MKYQVENHRHDMNSNATHLFVACSSKDINDDYDMDAVPRIIIATMMMTTTIF